MRPVGFAIALVCLAGCAETETPVYVDLSAIPVEGLGPMPEIEAPHPTFGAASAVSTTSMPMKSVEVNLGNTGRRIAAARDLIAKNREEALRGLSQALYRNYSREAEAQRRQAVRDLRELLPTLWDEGFGEISDLLHDHAEDRWPLLVKVALIVGFPLVDPASLPEGNTVWQKQRRAEAIDKYQKLKGEDAEYERQADQIMASIENDIANRRVQIQIEHVRKLNTASDRATAEAKQAVENNMPDFTPSFGPASDVRLPAVQPNVASLPAVEVSAPPVEASPERPNLRRQFLEHELSIWLGQNGYRRSATRLGVADRTKEFARWIQARRTGL